MLRLRPLGALQVDPGTLPQQVPAPSPLAAFVAQPLVRAATFGMLAGALTVAYGGVGCKERPSWTGAAAVGAVVSLLLGLVGSPDTHA